MSCNERLVTFLICFCNILCYVGTCNESRYGIPYLGTIFYNKCCTCFIIINKGGRRAANETSSLKNVGSADHAIYTKILQSLSSRQSDSKFQVLHYLLFFQAWYYIAKFVTKIISAGRSIMHTLCCVESGMCRNSMWKRFSSVDLSRNLDLSRLPEYPVFTLNGLNLPL